MSAPLGAPSGLPSGLPSGPPPGASPGLPSGMSTAPHDATDVTGGSVGGIVVYSMLTGILTVQVVKYLKAFSKDKLALKCMVVAIWIWNIFNLSALASGIYTTDVTYWNPQSAGAGTVIVLPWNTSLLQIGTVIAAVFTQCFLTRRLYRLTEGSVIPLFLLVLIAGHLGLGIAVQVKSIQIGGFFTFEDKDKWLMVAWFLVAALVDTLIGVLMCFHLYKKKTGFTQTDSVIRMIMIYSASSALLTGAVAIIALVGFAKSGFPWVLMFVMVPFGGVYSFSLLANLHSRTSFKQKLAGPFSIPMENMRVAPLSFSPLSPPTTDTSASTNASAIANISHNTAHAQPGTPASLHDQQRRSSRLNPDSDLNATDFREALPSTSPTSLVQLPGRWQGPGSEVKITFKQDVYVDEEYPIEEGGKERLGP